MNLNALVWLKAIYINTICLLLLLFSSTAQEQERLIRQHNLETQVWIIPADNISFSLHVPTADSSCDSLCCLRLHLLQTLDKAFRPAKNVITPCK